MSWESISISQSDENKFELCSSVADSSCVTNQQCAALLEKVRGKEEAGVSKTPAVISTTQDQIKESAPVADEEKVLSGLNSSKFRYAILITIVWMCSYMLQHGIGVIQHSAYQLKGLHERLEEIEQYLSATVKQKKDMEEQLGGMQGANAALRTEMAESKGNQAELLSHVNKLLGRLEKKDNAVAKVTMEKNELIENMQYEVNGLKGGHYKTSNELNKLFERLDEAEQHLAVTITNLKTEMIVSKKNQAELQMKSKKGDEEINQLNSRVASMELWSPCITNEVAEFSGYENRDAYGAGWCRDNGYEGASPQQYPHGYRDCRGGRAWHQFRCANTSVDTSDGIWTPCYRNEDAIAMGRSNKAEAGKAWCAGRQRGCEFTVSRACGNHYHQYKCM